MIRAFALALVLVPATASLASFALRLNPRVTLESISLRLMAAGMGVQFMEPPDEWIQYFRTFLA